MVSHERPTAVVTSEDVEPPQKKKPQRPSEVPEEATWEVSVFTHSADQVQCVRDFVEATSICDAGKKILGDWSIERFNIGSQPAGAFQEHEDTQSLHAFQEDGGTQPTETKEKYEDSQV